MNKYKNPISALKWKVGGDTTNSYHSEFWRELAWRCGDEQANRICSLLDIYCRIFKLPTKCFYSHLPRD